MIEEETLGAAQLTERAVHDKTENSINIPYRGQKFHL
jgi:hypothetical protein